MSSKVGSKSMTPSGEMSKSSELSVNVTDSPSGSNASNT